MSVNVWKDTGYQANKRKKEPTIEDLRKKEQDDLTFYKKLDISKKREIENILKQKAKTNCFFEDKKYRTRNLLACLDEWKRKNNMKLKDFADEISFNLGK